MTTQQTTKESSIFHHLPCNSWAVNKGHTSMSGCFSESIFDTLLSESPSGWLWSEPEGDRAGESAFWNTVWFLWFGSNKHLPYASTRCCPQSTTPDSWSIIRAGSSPWTCLEDDSLWQWWPELSTLQEPVSIKVWQKILTVSKGFKISDSCCSFLNFQITGRQVLPNLNLFESPNYVTEKWDVVLPLQ